MKCSECGYEIIDFPESKGYCRECETSLIEDFKERLKTASKEKKLDLLTSVTVELISRNELPDKI